MSLDEKIHGFGICRRKVKVGWIYEEDVKQFIEELKHMIEFECTPLPNAKGISNRLNSQVDIIAGKGLI